MTHINRLLLEGNLVKDAELKFTNSGTAVLNFSIANEVYGGKDKDNYTSFFNVTAFGVLAQKMAPYIIKGTTVLFTCTAKIENWTDNQGVQRYAFKAVIGFGDTIRITRKTKEAAARIQALADKNQNYSQPQGAPQNSGYSQPQNPPQTPAYSQPQNSEPFQDDIPF